MVQRPRFWFLVTAAVLLAFAAWSGVASRFGGTLRPLSGLNAPLYDISTEVTGLIRPQGWSKTLVVLIDQQTLDSPVWGSAPRALQQPQLGQLAEALLDRGARRVGFDFVIAFDPARIALPYALFSGWDQRFTHLLATHADQVVLGVDETVAPAARYTAMLPRSALGAIDLTTESDGVVRSVLTRTRLDGGRRVLGFAQALAGTTGSLTGGHALIVPSGSISQIPHVSAAALERCLASPEKAGAVADLIRGRIVLIGAALAGEDAHRGPDRLWPAMAAPAAGADPCRGGLAPVASREPGWLPGVFLQAAATESLLKPAPLTLAETPARVLTSLGIVLMALVALAKVNELRWLPDQRRWMFAGTFRAGLALVVAFATLGVGSVAIEVGAQLLAHSWLPIGPILTAVAVVGVTQTLTSAVRRDIAIADLRISFGRWLPPPVVEATLAAKPVPVAGQERVITVLIADLMNFTNFCAQHHHEPERIVTALNKKFSSAQLVIDHFGGCLDKFDGDAVIAFWNGIDEQPDHAQRAVAAAREIVVADADDDALRFKCAIATGVAFVGCYGSGRKSSFSAIGEPMNLAARLESICRPHGLRIAIAEGTRNACRASVAGAALAELRLSGKLGEARLKGFSEPMAFYTVEPDGRERRPTGVVSLADPLAVEREA